MTPVRLQIDGMSCGHCVGRVRNALSSLDGVTIRALDVGTADLDVDETRQPLSAVLASVEHAGYRAVVTPAGIR